MYWETKLRHTHVPVLFKLNLDLLPIYVLFETFYGYKANYIAPGANRNLGYCAKNMQQHKTIFGMNKC